MLLQMFLIEHWRCNEIRVALGLNTGVPATFALHMGAEDFGNCNPIHYPSSISAGKN
jgi:hypothetical protein